MKDVNIICKCYHEPQDDCQADVHFKQFETDVWSEPELDGLDEVLHSIQRDVALTEKQMTVIGRAIIQCYRPTDKKRQFFLDWHYAQYPEDKPADRDPAGLDALVEAARNAVSALDATISPGMVSDIDLQGIYKDIVNAKFRLKSALAAFEGREGESDGR